MHKTIVGLSSALLAGCSLSMAATPAFAEEVAASKLAHYSVSETLVGTLLADPAAVEILKRLIPTVYENEQFQSAGRSLTLKAIQQYEPDALSDENLAKIQAEFDKIPAKG